MNAALQEFARQQLKDGLSKCTEAQRDLFRRMYSHKDLTCPMDEVVDRMPEDKLDWAMQQVENTLVEAGHKK